MTLDQIEIQFMKCIELGSNYHDLRFLVRSYIKPLIEIAKISKNSEDENLKLLIEEMEKK